MASMSGHRFHTARLVLLAAFLVGVPTATAAQEGALGTGGIKGHVRDSLGMGIMGVEITMPGSRLRAETDDKGDFLLAKVPAGPLSLRFRRLGFMPDTVDLMVLAGKTIPLDVLIARVALDLRPVVVYGRESLTGWRAEFYHRKSLGVGHFITREDIEKRDPMYLTDMFRSLPGAAIRPNPQGVIRNQVRLRDSRCAPLVWLDGSPLASGEFDLDAVSPRSIEAMEIYNGSAMAPPRYRVNSALRSGCGGTIILWSREAPPRPKDVRRGPVSAAATLANLVDTKQLFTATEVDSPARQDSSKHVRPQYPDDLFEAGIGGSVLAEFVVHTDGTVIAETFNVVMSTHPAFNDAVLRALETAVYMPAMRKGYPVQQLVQHEFRFVPDSTRKK